MSCPNCQPKPRGLEPREPPNPGEPTIVLVGNPNVGKSTLFNMATGARQAVVNAPGTTVEVMQGRWGRLTARLLDLPGTYSLIANSPDEQVVVDTLAGAAGSLTDQASGRSIDLVLVLLDATSLTRSLYLLGQVAQTGRPVAAVVTMIDVVEHEGEHVDTSALSRTLGIPVVAMDPRRKGDFRDLETMVSEALLARPRVKSVAADPTAPGYNALAAAAADDAPTPTEIRDVGRDLLAETTCNCPPTQREHCHRAAPAIDSTAAVQAAQLDGADRAVQLFGWVEEIQAGAGRVSEESGALSRSDKIDRLLLHPLFGIPVFFALMAGLFQVAGGWGVGIVQDWADRVFSDGELPWSLAALLGKALAAVGLADTWVDGLLVGGIATGLGVVASFLPLMFVIFLAISILEDSGYMARAAFLGDRVMRLIGLDGRVILPLIMGFGCNLPSLAAIRTLPNAKQRLVTALIIPYTSCAARLTIYLMIARIFFPNHTGTIVFAMYCLSIVMVIFGALVLKPFITKGTTQAPLMLVLPPYQMPRIFIIVKNTWMRTWAFVKGAGKIIIVMTIFVWLLGAIPTSSEHKFGAGELPMEDSVYGTLARGLEPVFTPAGFGEWHLTGSLMTGFVAKETVISSIVVSYGLDSAQAGNAEEGGADLGTLPDLVRSSFNESTQAAAPGAPAELTGWAAFAFLLFVLTYTPCLATVAEQVRQIGVRWTLGAVLVQLAAAWILAVIVFQVGRVVV